MSDRLLVLFGALGVVALGILIVLGVATLRVAPEPQIKIEPSVPVIGRKTPVKVEVSQSGRGLSRVKVEFVQGDRTETLAEKNYPHRSVLRFWGERTLQDTIAVEVGRDTITGLRSGEATIRVTVDRAGTWLRSPEPARQFVVLPVRLAPPTLQVTSIQTYVAQGGCEAVVYRVGEGTVRDGVRCGSWWFPGFPLPGGGQRDRFSLFAVPYDMNSPEPRLVAADAAGNEAAISFIDKFFPKAVRSDKIEVSDAFLAKVVTEIMSQSPEVPDRGSPLNNYLEINRALRGKNAQTLRDIGSRSRPEFLWNQPFMMMPNGKVMSAFADRRTYFYEGREIDRQDHLGYDLAVTARAPTPASNSGTVVLARFFGIYGNAVVIDHGYGLMTLYGHLSSIGVSEGQQVKRGDIIGNTGETGLAGGDHLHFTTMLQGLPVNPVEWWDGHWIRDRIARKLGAALPLQE